MTWKVRSVCVAFSHDHNLYTDSRKPLVYRSVKACLTHAWLSCPSVKTCLMRTHGCHALVYSSVKTCLMRTHGCRALEQKVFLYASMHRIGKECHNQERDEQACVF